MKKKKNYTYPAANIIYLHGGGVDVLSASNLKGDTFGIEDYDNGVWE